MMYQLHLLVAPGIQHVILVHFPIALFIAAVALDLVGQSSKRKGLADAAYYNLLLAAISTIPVLATGILSWQFKFEGEKLQGVLLLHVVLGTISTLMIWMVWWVNRQSRRRSQALPTYRLGVEFLAVVIVALTAHLGGLLSGVIG
jgi:uncharacterized membrane protein